MKSSSSWQEVWGKLSQSHFLGPGEPEMAWAPRCLAPSVWEEITKGEARQLSFEMSVMSRKDKSTHRHTHI